MTQPLARSQFPLAIVGNVFEHYDKALYGLLAPFIAPLFFPKSSYLVALILAYLPYSILLQPLVFYFLRREESLKHILLFSLLGMSVVTLAIGCIPTYHSIGILAPLLLATFRALQGLFASIEAAAAPLFLLDHAPKEQRNHFSFLYEMSSQAGLILASLLITLLVLTGHVESHWRTLFFLGGGTGTIGYAMRYFRLKDLPMRSAPSLKRSDLLPTLRIALVTGFICLNYLFCMELINSFVPMISTLTLSTMMVLHLTLSLFDFALLPLFSALASRYGRDRLMITCSFATALLAIPLFTLLHSPSWATILLVRSALIGLGLGCAVCYQNWCRDNAKGTDRFFTLAIGKMLGKKLISDPAISISFLLFHSIGSYYSIPIYLAFFALICALVLLSPRRLLKHT